MNRRIEVYVFELFGVKTVLKILHWANQKKSSNYETVFSNRRTNIFTIFGDLIHSQKFERIQCHEQHLIDILKVAPEGPSKLYLFIFSWNFMLYRVSK